MSPGTYAYGQLCEVGDYVPLTARETKAEPVMLRTPFNPVWVWEAPGLVPTAPFPLFFSGRRYRQLSLLGRHKRLAGLRASQDLSHLVAEFPLSVCRLSR